MCLQAVNSMPNESPLVIGIDIGTGGVRALAATIDGEVVATQAADFPVVPEHLPEGHHEQDPEMWWQTACRALGRLADQLKKSGVSPDVLQGVAVDGTSGTLAALDAAGRPVRPALMYNDLRGAEQAEKLNELASDFLARHGYSFNASFSAAKILYLQENEPQTFEHTARFAHQADFVAARLTGEPVVTDFNNALKTGYDLLEDRWPGWLAVDPGIGDRLPPVVEPGTRIGRISPTAAEQTGLPAGLAVMAGTTDGVAACLASGLQSPGDYNTSLGTTLVFKGLSDRISLAPGGLVYSHKLPGGRWLPGAASNTGAEWIGRWFRQTDLVAMDARATHLIPFASVAYPLARRGERFPFVRSQAEGFFVREPDSGLQRYAACLLGTALVERLCYEVLDAVTGESAGAIYATGGGSRSDLWNQCRADVTERVVHRPQRAESAFGSAVLVASSILGEPLERVIHRMVHIETSFFPNVSRAGLYRERFEEFGNELRRRGYL